MTSAPNSVSRVAAWLAAHPAPIHTTDVPAWSDRVRTELGESALSDLVDLLTHGELEQQYQAMAAARILGGEVWADGDEPIVDWVVTLPGDARPERFRPRGQLPD